MNRDELLDLHEGICDRARALMESKSEDYSPGDSVFENLEAATDGDPGPRAVSHYVLNRTYEKLHRLRNYIETGGYSGSEKADSDVRDAINQLILLYAYTNIKEG